MVSFIAVVGFYQYRSVNASNRMAVELANTVHISAPLLETAIDDNKHSEARRILRLPCISNLPYKGILCGKQGLSARKTRP
ncbi:MAG: hypothetical protein ACPHOL_00260 [Candidatus Puniceispirillum sp.]